MFFKTKFESNCIELDADAHSSLKNQNERKLVLLLPQRLGQWLVTLSLFRLSVFVTQFSVSITHNSKMMGPIVKRLFGQTITLFS